MSRYMGRVRVSMSLLRGEFFSPVAKWLYTSISMSVLFSFLKASNLIGVLIAGNFSSVACRLRYVVSICTGSVIVRFGIGNVSTSVSVFGAYGAIVLMNQVMSIWMNKIGSAVW